MKIEVHMFEAIVAREAAKTIAAEARRAVADRGRFVVAFSGGRTPWLMLRALAAHRDVPWDRMYVFQVDERVAPPGHPDRNWTHLHDNLLARAPLPPEQVYPMPVGGSDLPRAARHYSAALEETAGAPPVLDLVHLGLGPDGHTASLVPGDPDLNVGDADVAATGVYQGRRRMTLTYPIINRARRILWVVTGSEKADALARMRVGDGSIPAGRISHDRAIVICDRAAATKLEAA